MVLDDAAGFLDDRPADRLDASLAVHPRRCRLDHGHSGSGRMGRVEQHATRADEPDDRRPNGERGDHEDRELGERRDGYHVRGRPKGERNEGQAHGRRPVPDRAGARQHGRGDQGQARKADARHATRQDRHDGVGNERPRGEGGRRERQALCRVAQGEVGECPKRRRTAAQESTHDDRGLLRRAMRFRGDVNRMRAHRPEASHRAGRATPPRWYQPPGSNVLAVPARSEMQAQVARSGLNSARRSRGVSRGAIGFQSASEDLSLGGDRTQYPRRQRSADRRRGQFPGPPPLAATTGILSVGHPAGRTPPRGGTCST